MNEGPLFSVEEIAKATAAQWISGSPSPLPLGEGIKVRGVSIDSRSIRPGELFVAIRGLRFDGHHFLERAFAQGAAGALVEKLPEKSFSKPLWKVPSTLQALGDLAHFHRMRFRIPVIGVTGSSGKTATKAMIHHMGGGEHSILATVGTQNNLIGVPMLLLQLTAETETAVVEMGTNQWGEIRRLSQIASPTIGLVTNIGPAHLQTFGDLEGVLREKSGLWETLSPQAPLILPADDSLLWRAGQMLSRKVIWFSATRQADIRAEQVVLHAWGSRCLVNGRWTLNLPLPGRHNLMNALGACACALAIGEDLGQAVERLSSAPAVSGRLVQRRMNGCLVLDDTYNANPASLEAALAVLNQFPSDGRKVAVIGDMLELGERAEFLHRQAGQWVAECGVDLLVTVGSLARFLGEEAIRSGMPRETCSFFETAEEAGGFLTDALRSGDTILVKGSRGMRMEKVLEWVPRCSITSSTH